MPIMPPTMEITVKIKKKVKINIPMFSHPRRTGTKLVHAEIDDASAAWTTGKMASAATAVLHG